ncbi:MAG: hypothetical protein HRU19_11525 [Pseudobacteriovorax sp.]|nr:hypothetical protein [Pseudobacteriovorax sp.]
MNQNNNNFSSGNTVFFNTFRKVHQSDRQSDTSWQTITRNLWPLEKAVSDVWLKPFDNVLEKHMALQATAVLTGNYDYLLRWPQRPWDDPQSLDYAITGMDRSPRRHPAAVIQESKLDLIKIISPILRNIFDDRFTLNLYHKSHPSIENINRAAVVSLNDHVLNRSLFYLTKHEISKKGYVFKNLPGMNNKIFLDTKANCFFFDSSYFCQQPVAHIFHPISLMIKACESSLFAFLHLDPVKESFPAIKMLARSIEGNFSNQIVAHLSDSEKQQLLELKIGSLTEADLFSLWNQQWDRLYATQLEETLDLVGLVESSLGINLFDHNSPTILRLLFRNSRVQQLLKHSTNINFFRD